MPMVSAETQDKEAAHHTCNIMENKINAQTRSIIIIIHNKTTAANTRVFQWSLKRRKHQQVNQETQTEEKIHVEVSQDILIWKGKMPLPQVPTYLKPNKTSTLKVKTNKISPVQKYLWSQEAQILALFCKKEPIYREVSKMLAHKAGASKHIGNPKSDKERSLINTE